MAAQRSVDEILTLFAIQTSVQPFRTWVIPLPTLRDKYKESCPEELPGNMRPSFQAVQCLPSDSLSNLRAQRDRFIRCAVLRDWFRTRKPDTNREHLPPIRLAWEFAYMCQECILAKNLTPAQRRAENIQLEYLHVLSDEMSSNENAGRSAPRYNTRRSRRNAAARADATRGRHRAAG